MRNRLPIFSSNRVGKDWDGEGGKNQKLWPLLFTFTASLPQCLLLTPNRDRRDYSVEYKGGARILC